MEHVCAALNYLAPGSARNRLYVAPGDHLATTRYEPRMVRIHDRRPCLDDFTLPRRPCRRAVYTSLWRTFSPPPQDCPLALCDYRSTDDAEGSPNLLFRVRELPAPHEVSEVVDDADAESAASVFAYSCVRWRSTTDRCFR